MISTQAQLFEGIVSTLEKKAVPSQKAATTAEPFVYPLCAYQLAENLKLKEIAKIFDLKPMVLNPNQLIYEIALNAYCIFFNFGALVFFNIDPETQQTTLDRVQKSLGEVARQPPPNRETLTLEVHAHQKNSVSFDQVTVDKLTREKIELVSLVLAQSTALEHFENKVEEILNRLGGLLAHLAKRRLPRWQDKKIMSMIDMALATKQSLLTRLCLLEKPDVTWENKMLDDLYQEATMMFELRDRFRILDYKLKSVQENLHILSNFVANRQHLFLEASILGLIVLEIILAIF